MTKDQTTLRFAPQKARSPSSPTRVLVLAVGDTRKWDQAGNLLPTGTQIAFAAIEDITEDFLTIIEPETIISPVLARSFDCADLAEQLHALRFRGRYRAISDDLPNPDLIRREICQLCPGLDFEIVSSASMGLRAVS